MIVGPKDIVPNRLVAVDPCVHARGSQDIDPQRSACVSRCKPPLARRHDLRLLIEMQQPREPPRAVRLQVIGNQDPLAVHHQYLARKALQTQLGRVRRCRFPPHIGKLRGSVPDVRPSRVPARPPLSVSVLPLPVHQNRIVVRRFLLQRIARVNHQFLPAAVKHKAVLRGMVVPHTADPGIRLDQTSQCVPAQRPSAKREHCGLRPPRGPCKVHLHVRVIGQHRHQLVQRSDRRAHVPGQCLQRPPVGTLPARVNQLRNTKQPGVAIAPGQPVQPFHRGYNSGPERIFNRRARMQIGIDVMDRKIACLPQPRVRMGDGLPRCMLIQVDPSQQRPHGEVPVGRPLVEPPVLRKGLQRPLQAVPAPGHPHLGLGDLAVKRGASHADGVIVEPVMVLLHRARPVHPLHKGRLEHESGLVRQLLPDDPPLLLREPVVEPVVGDRGPVDHIGRVQVQIRRAVRPAVREPFIVCTDRENVSPDCLETLGRIRGISQQARDRLVLDSPRPPRALWRTRRGRRRASQHPLETVEPLSGRAALCVAQTLGVPPRHKQTRALFRQVGPDNRRRIDLCRQMRQLQASHADTGPFPQHKAYVRFSRHIQSKTPIRLPVRALGQYDRLRLPLSVHLQPERIG